MTLFSSSCDTRPQKIEGEDLCRVLALLEIPGEPIQNLGSYVDMHHQGWHLRIRPQCLCMHATCPRCTRFFEHAYRRNMSAHDALALEPKWRKTGFVEGYGTPNLWLKNDTQDVKIWWTTAITDETLWMTSGPNWNTLLYTLTTLLKTQRSALVRRKKLHILQYLLDITQEDVECLDQDAHTATVDALYERTWRGKALRSSFHSKQDWTG